MKQPSLSVRVVVVVATVLSAAVVFLLLPRTAHDVVEAFDREGGPVELLTALFFLAGSALCVYRIAAKTPRDRPYLYLWAGACFLFFGEETSWLQHMIGYGTPEAVSAVNVQQEFNLHNLLEAGSLHEAFTTGKFDYKLFFNTEMMFYFGFFSYFVAFPAVARTKWLAGLARKLKFPLPTISFILFLLVVLALSIFGYVLTPELRNEFSEARELYFALFILLYVVVYLGTEEAGA